MQTQTPELLKLPEVMQMTKHRKTTIYGLIKKGEFPAQVKRGRATFWRRSEVQEWLNSLEPATH
ncbi:helix-turn-helix transcriptional regulator [Terasakiella pusilla]|uniref:helix-turn-helix transcriptional regulator n=1 Tax=Terasakiella pusilla TaxID=64973 RepID=UPI003AA8849C